MDGISSAAAQLIFPVLSIIALYGSQNRLPFPTAVRGNQKM
jgi:hypothetical protein